MVSNNHIAIVERYKEVVIQIATPYSKGTGFYIHKYDLIVTNEHVVRDNREVVVDGKHFARQLVEVLYLDEIYDLAFLKAPRDNNLPTIVFRDEHLIRCGECKQVVEDKSTPSQRCTSCGSKVSYISKIPLYEPIGINRQIEEMLAELDHNAVLARRGPYNWEIEQGSALIHVAYHEKTGLITGDAHLCRIPDNNILPLYSYLLKANYELEGLNFTVKESEVILSLLIFDQYLNKMTALRLFEHLFEMADYYDDILVNDFNAKWLTF